MYYYIKASGNRIYKIVLQVIILLIIPKAKKTIFIVFALTIIMINKAQLWVYGPIALIVAEWLYQGLSMASNPNSLHKKYNILSQNLV